MIYKEFEEYTPVFDINCPLINFYKDALGNTFYVEPLFYTHLQGFFERLEDKIPVIMAEIKRVVEKNHKVIFTGNFDSPQVIKDDYIYLEIEDITNPLKIFVEDKSRGSDYGD